MLIGILLLVALAAVGFVLARGTSDSSRFAGCEPVALGPGPSPVVRQGDRLPDLEAAEAFVCHDVPRLSQTSGMEGPVVSAAPADYPASPGGRAATATLLYFDTSRSFIIEASRAPPSSLDDGRASEQVDIEGMEVTLLDVPDIRVARWEVGGIHVMALGDGLSREEFLDLIASLE